MRIAEINMVDYGSTGKIMFQIASCARKHGHEVKTYSMKWRNQKKCIQDHKYFGYFIENSIHLILAKSIGFHGCFSYFGTKQLIKDLKIYKPQIIHLHNLHNYCVNLSLLFAYIKEENIKVIWTLHDCWPFTGGCMHFTLAKCNSWQKGCNKCPQLEYVGSKIIDCSPFVWQWKKECFLSISNMILVTPSQWLANLTRKSFLKKWPVKVINNGINLAIFKPTLGDFRNISLEKNTKKFLVLGVAMGWSERKGLDVFIKLAQQLDNRFKIVLVGTDAVVDKKLPSNIMVVHRTENQRRLAEIYTSADVFVNPTREDNFPTTNIEAIACGTPVVTFDTGGSSEMLDNSCGSIIENENYDFLVNEIIRICVKKPYSHQNCIMKARQFDMNDKYLDYVKLYEI